MNITYVFRKSPQWVFYLCFVSGRDQEIRECLRTKFKPNLFIKINMIRFMSAYVPNLDQPVYQNVSDPVMSAYVPNLNLTSLSKLM